MSVRTLFIAAGIVGGATTTAFAQVGWDAAGDPGTFAYGYGCYACAPGRTVRAGPNGALLDYVGPAFVGDGVDGYALVPYAADPLHTGSNYFWFRSDGPGRGNAAESER